MKIEKVNYNWRYTPSARPKSAIMHIILHHAAAPKCTPQQVHSWHLANGWAGIGYNYFVAKDGTIYEGRTELQCGAHTEGYNTSGMGICCEGNYQVETMPDAQRKALVELLQDLRSRYGNLPIKGHKHFNATSCPGDKFPLDEIVAEVEGKKTEVKKEVAEATAKQEVCEVKLPVLGKGDKGKSVESLQGLLIYKGYNCGGYGADGDFGNGTEKSVKAFQQDNKLTADGIVGEKTWSKLLGV